MLSLDMLDVLIGMVLVFLLISLICSAINEIIEAKLKLRAVDLEQGIRELLSDPKGTGLVKKFYEHPLIYSLFRGDYDPKQIRTNTKLKKQRYSRGSDLPSYIPARNFALAVMDVVLPANTATPATASNASLSGAAAALTSVTVNDGANPLQRLRNAANNIQHNDNLKGALLTIIDAAGNDAVKAREGIENWFNGSMDRVSGWYKRRVQTIVFIMGFAVAIAMNADSFAIFNNLANNRPLRNAIVAQAQTISTQNITDSASTATDKLRKNVNSLISLGLPIGWTWKSGIYPQGVSNPDAIPDASAAVAWILKFFGWLVTGLAVSLGAPFWFDILNKVMVVRATVKPTEKSPDESSDDRQAKKS